jgi:hypothetical protein
MPLQSTHKRSYEFKAFHKLPSYSLSLSLSLSLSASSKMRETESTQLKIMVATTANEARQPPSSNKN